jgi:hypothetical protein
VLLFLQVASLRTPVVSGLLSKRFCAMSNAKKDFLFAEQESAFEMIELAIDGVDVLARAFDIISDVCRETDTPRLSLLENPPRELVN